MVPPTTSWSMCLPQGLFFSEKTRPWNFGACILWILLIFADLRVPPSTPWSMCLPQGLFFSQKTRPWNFGACLLWILSIFVDFIGNWTSFTEKCVKFTKLYSKTSFLVFARWSRRSRRSGVMKCCSDPPSTRAGGQDDVSFTNSLKLVLYLMECFKYAFNILVVSDGMFEICI